MDAHSAEAELDSATDQVEPAIPVLRPRLPSAEQLLPYLRRMDATRVYTNWGPVALELEERLCRCFSLPVGGVVSASSGTSALTAAILTAAGRAAGRRRLAIIPALTFATAASVEVSRARRPVRDPCSAHCGKSYSCRTARAKSDLVAEIDEAALFPSILAQWYSGDSSWRARRRLKRRRRGREREAVARPVRRSTS
jgi:hypothetical protein